jgi:hypothetical protein
MVGEWLGVDDGWRRTKSYWWSGGFAAARQARPDAAKRRVIAKPPTKCRSPADPLGGLAKTSIGEPGFATGLANPKEVADHRCMSQNRSPRSADERRS